MSSVTYSIRSRVSRRHEVADVRQWPIAFKVIAPEVKQIGSWGIDPSPNREGGFDVYSAKEGVEAVRSRILTEWICEVTWAIP
jgi:hypothetical protein